MKTYRFIFDEQTGQFSGITRENPFPENSTDLAPFFQSGYKTVFDRSYNEWKLVNEEKFFEQVNVKDVLKDQDLFCIKKLNDVFSVVQNSHDTIVTDIESLDLMIKEELRKINSQIVNSERQITKIQTANYHALEQQLRRLGSDVQLVLSCLNRIGYEVKELKTSVHKQYWFSRAVNFIVLKYYEFLNVLR